MFLEIDIDNIITNLHVEYFLYFIPVFIVFEIFRSAIGYFACIYTNKEVEPKRKSNNTIDEFKIKSKEIKEEDINNSKLNNSGEIINNYSNNNNNNTSNNNKKLNQYQMDFLKGKSFIEEGKVYDEKREYKSALVYYTDGIEKLLPLTRVNKELREYVDFYMGRAEHIKSETKKLSPEIMDFYKYSIHQKNLVKQQLLEKEKEQQLLLKQQQFEQEQLKKQESLSTKFSNLFSGLSSGPTRKQEIIDVDNDIPLLNNKPVQIPKTTTTTTTNTSLTNSGNKIINKQQQPIYKQSSTGSLNKSIGGVGGVGVGSTRINQSRSPLSKQGSLTNVVSGSPGGGNTYNSSNSKLPDIKGIDQQSLQIIMSEIVDRTQPITWNDVVGLEKVKQSLNESVILPNLRPDVFKGLRAPPKGLLLFGPPGNGKTMIAKACANESKVTFFSISASSLTSKYVGESEKLVRALFAAATYYQPSIIFIDEIDSILNERSTNESDATRRLKTEILIQFDGVKTTGTDRVLVIGATNRPDDLDDAALRRLVKRIYVGLPEKDARLQIIQHLLKDQQHSLTSLQLNKLADATIGYSGFDLTALCKDAAYEPIRQLGLGIKDLNLNQIRPISFKDFQSSLRQIRPSVSNESLKSYEDWNLKFGTI